MITYCKRTGHKWVMCKLDFEKAFDKASWKFLLLILQARVFPSKWMCWIHGLLSSTIVAILVNGKPSSWIWCKQGLWQGDPPSPTLFILATVVLSRGLFKRLVLLVWLNALVQIVHLGILNAYNLQMILSYSVQVKRKFDGNESYSFSLWIASTSRLKINFHKSFLVCISILDENISLFATMMNCKKGSFPFTYLVLPLSDCKLLELYWLPIMERINKRLVSWKGKYLS